MIVKTYLAFDNLVMKGVNTGVKAYNWTFGGTKADLANKFNLGYSSLTTAGIVSSGVLPLQILSIFPIPAMYKLGKTYKDIEKTERLALEKNMKDSNVEVVKRLLKLGSPAVTFLGAQVFLSGSTINSKNPQEDKIKFGIALAGLGTVCAGAGAYVMRADNLPPQKNCLSRGTDKLKTLIDSYKRQPRFACGLEDRI